MAVDASGHPQRGLPGRLRDGATKLMNGLGTGWIFCLMILICADIAGRYLLHSPITGVAETVTFSIVCIVFLQLPDALRLGKLTRSDGLLGTLAMSRPRVAFAMDGIANLMGAALLVVIAWGLFPHALVAWRQNYFLGAQGAFTIPVWPMNALVILGSAMGALHFLAHAYRALAGIFRQRSQTE